MIWNLRDEILTTKSRRMVTRWSYLSKKIILWYSIKTVADRSSNFTRLVIPSGYFRIRNRAFRNKAAPHVSGPAQAKRVVEIRGAG